MMEYLRQMGALIWKDLVVEIRTRERVAAMGAFSVLVGVLFSFAIDPSVVEDDGGALVPQCQGTLHHGGRGREQRLSVPCLEGRAATIRR